jgi:hypothetical protein
VRVRFATALGVLSCTPTSSERSEPAPSTETVVRAPPTVSADNEYVPIELAVEKVPTGLAGLVEDLAVVLLGGSVVQDSAQCSAGAPWAAAEEDDLEPADLRGKVLHVVDAHGVSEATVPPSGWFASASRLRLATHAHVPSSGASLRDRWLQRRVPDGERIAAWAHVEIGKPSKVVGEIRGAFGDGVDRIVVLAPHTLPTMDDDAEAWRVSEIAVLVAGETPRGRLPFTRTFEGDAEDFVSGIHGLQVAGIVDLDGDGIEEVVWSSHRLGEELTTELHVSYFADGEHRVHELSSCTYVGCNAALPAKRCRGPVKRMR